MDPPPRTEPQPRTLSTGYLPQQRHFSKFKIMHPPPSPTPGNFQTLVRSLLFNTDRAFACCVHLCILAGRTVPRGWQGLCENCVTQSRLNGGKTHLCAQALGWGWGEQATVERKDESGFLGLRMQTGRAEKAGTLLAQSTRNPGPKVEKQVARHSHHKRVCVCVFL